jgi:SAM-dependent methyltransferase
VDDSSLSTRATYDAIAARFIEKVRDRAEIAPLLDRFAAALRPGALVLDLGAGPGLDTADHRRRGLRAIGLDFSLGMLRAGVREWPGPRVQADARRLPIASVTVAAVWANASLLHLDRDDARRALMEVRRVLCSQGLLFVSVKEGHGAETETARYGQPRFFQYWTASELDAALDAAGFDVVERTADVRPRNTWLTRLAQRKPS